MQITPEIKTPFLELQFTDIFGRIKSVTIPSHKAQEAFTNGLWFDGSSIEGFSRIHESDMFLTPDPSTLAILPWTSSERKVTRVYCDVHTPDGKPFAGDPRGILKRSVAKAESMGYSYFTGPELEFFLFRKGDCPQPVLHDIGGYFDSSTKDLANTVRKDAVLALESMGLEIEAEHHEVANGQHEIDFKYGPAVRTADSAIAFKHAVKSVASMHDLYATFMPKPVFGQNGSGMHVHQSLFSKDTNLFYGEGDPYNLSKLAYRFIAGQLHYIKEITAVLCPTVNSYKRLVPGYEAACYISWAQINRSALIRIPRIFPGKAKAARVELRCPDPSCNPYLAFAAMLAAGLKGIEDNLEPPPPVNENVFHFDDRRLEELGIGTLPGNLKDAIIAFKRSKLMRDLFGEETHEKYVAAKLAEWDDFRLHVTDWEKKRYFEEL